MPRIKKGNVVFWTYKSVEQPAPLVLSPTCAVLCYKIGGSNFILDRPRGGVIVMVVCVGLEVAH